MQPSIRFVRSSDGTMIAYARWGSGPPLVKAAHWLTHLEFDRESPVWRPRLRELSRDHTLVRYDERGCGLSDREVEDLSFEAWGRDNPAFRQVFTFMFLPEGSPEQLEWFNRLQQETTSPHIAVRPGRGAARSHIRDFRLTGGAGVPA